MQEIEELAYETYSKNLEYFSKHHKEVSKLLTIFDMAVSKGDYEPQYDLEFIDGMFDIKDLKSSKYLYNKNSKEISSDFTKSVNYRKNNRIFEGFPIYTFTDEQLETLTIYEQKIAGMLPIMRYYSSNFHQSDHMKEIEKFMFIGVGLGMHLPLIDKKIAAQEYLIVEDSLELFKLSLFATAYYELAENATLSFSVADEENIFLDTVKQFLGNTFYANRYIKYAHFPTHSNQKIKLIQSALMTQSFIFFPYKIELDKFLGPLNFINNGYKTLNLSKQISTTLAENKPTLVLGAGPSFKTNLPWIKLNQDKFIIIAVSAVLKALQKNKITPDIVTHIDGSAEADAHFENIDLESILKDSLIVLGSNASPALRKSLNKENIYNFEENTNYYDGYTSLPAACVGSFSILLSLTLGARESYLLGVDLAVDQSTGATHYSEEHIAFENADIENKNKLHNNMSYIKNLFEVKGNFTDTVYTNSLLHSSVQLLYQTVPLRLSKEQVVYNMSSGVYIPKTIPKHIEDVDLAKYETLQKDEIMKALASSLDANSIKELTRSDLNSLNNRIEHAKSLIVRIEAYVNAPLKNTANEYLYDLLGLVSDILRERKRESVNIIRVFFNYFQYAIPLIMDALNTKGLKNEKRHIKKFNKLLTDEMIYLSKTYLQTLEKFKEERC